MLPTTLSAYDLSLIRGETEAAQHAIVGMSCGEISGFSIAADETWVMDRHRLLALGL
jgi:hypothetical protein